MFNLFCTLPALPAAKPQPIPLRCMKVPPLPVTPNRAVVYARTADRHVGVLETSTIPFWLLQERTAASWSMPR